MKKNFKLIIATMAAFGPLMTQAQQNAKPEDTELWTPVPAKVTPAKVNTEGAPSDAIVLFDGKDLDQWVSAADREKPADWFVKKGILTVNKSGLGNIETKKSFKNYQLHIEWRVPADISGEGQARGNSGVFLASLGKGDAGYELQVLDNYENKTYVNGMAGSIYKQFAPLVNPSLKAGEWQSYDVIWTAPVFNEDGSVRSPARVTVSFNGVLVQNNTELLGPTQYIGKPSYSVKHDAVPIKLQAHGDKSLPISFRNIWVREL
ncbi:protein of unknown function [Chitinophaga costaii]|uniref:3-keto-alpha-glucoside-1,2-lyase/3-keto-2-hydroxy-glucal hydratase domain-containing protein n=1 Tax=Chitinophaga costaii TaxID=1335309 RepID=A0A1C4D0U4_9BACT|nr:DUF1080 domain-containing protein [Chitinophaga costaii]PUZ24412.1 DUF1080 domain-containing protein [Chitinophaga costaii]SCC24947.1 protein of unknown function [Chitinophaga costaii]